MELRRRFVFRGNAAGFGGRIVRPNDVILQSTGGSCLPVTGGRSAWSENNVDLADFVRLRSSSTSAEGRLDDTKKAIELSHGRGEEGTLTTTTRVRAEVRDLTVGAKPFPLLKVNSVRATLTATSPSDGYEPSIKLHDDTAFDDISINGHQLDVEIEKTIFQRHDTHTALLKAADDPGWVKEHGHHFYMNTPARGGLVRGSGYILGTIVKRIKWRDRPFDGAEIDENSLIVKDFGTIFFGEILINASARRLTMLRLKLGSPTGGDAVFVEVDTNGSWSI
jgi:hypothetical protein